MSGHSKIRVVAVNDVQNGGYTYLDYLRFAIDLLPDNCIVDVMQSPKHKVGITVGQAEDVLRRPVTEFNSYSSLINMQGVDVVISNDGYCGRFLDDSVFAVTISHGSSVMPANSEYYFSEWTAYWDAVLCSSRSSIAMTSKGMSLYRKNRKSLSIKMDPVSIRSDVRKTYFCPVSPIKKPEFSIDGLCEGESGGFNDKEFTIGILPTSVNAVRPGVSIYNSLNIISEIRSAFPESKIVFRPYPADVAIPEIKMLVDGLVSHGDGFIIDVDGRKSADFYKECDVIITDGSTGGVSFMLSRGTPPIYYIPQKVVDRDLLVQWFVSAMEGKVHIACSVPELIRLIGECKFMTAGERLGFYDRYCNSELWMDISNNEAVSVLIDPDIRESRFVCVDYSGNIINP